MKYKDSDGQILRIENYYNRKEYRNSNDKLHRLDGPAREWTDGGYSWWKEGKRHRTGGPAIFSPAITILPRLYWHIEGKQVDIYYICG